MKDLRQEVRGIVEDVLEDVLGVRFEPQDDEPLLSSGLIDSMALTQVLERIQHQLELSVDPLDLTLDNFDSLTRIEGYCRAASAVGAGRLEYAHDMDTAGR